MSKHAIRALEDGLPGAGVPAKTAPWIGGEAATPEPLARALTQAAPMLDPLSEPSVVATINEAREAAEAEGYAAGQERLDALLAELRTALGGVDAAISAATRRDAEAITELALAVAAGLIGREIAGDIESLTERVHDALKTLNSDKSLTIRLSPADREAIETSEPLELATVSSDESLASGEFVIESSGSLLDARIESRLEPLRSKLIDLLWEDDC